MTCLGLDAALSEHSGKEVNTTDCEYQEEEDQYDNCVFEQGQSTHDRLDDELEPRYIVDGTQGSQDSKGSQTLQGHARFLLLTVCCAGSRLCHREVGRHDDYEVKDVEAVPQVGPFVQDETHAHNFEHHFDCVETLEDVLDQVFGLSWLLIGFTR